ncbi:MAG: replication initiator protein A [Abitibacteriaceae bacterium]|nr:replication initiator protein A [Abditibacteriaceae bacterium]
MKQLKLTSQPKRTPPAQPRKPPHQQPRNPAPQLILDGETVTSPKSGARRISGASKNGAAPDQPKPRGRAAPASKVAPAVAVPEPTSTKNTTTKTTASRQSTATREPTAVGEVAETLVLSMLDGSVLEFTGDSAGDRDSNRDAGGDYEVTVLRGDKRAGRAEPDKAAPHKKTSSNRMNADMPASINLDSATGAAPAPLAITPMMGAADLIRGGKDELNLIEYPWASLWKHEDKRAVIYQEWEGRHPVTGKNIKASWKVEGSPTLGLPTAADLRVYLVLMELTRDCGFQQTVPFTRYDLVKRLGYTNTQKNYEALMNSFQRLKGMTITARNAFWDAKAKSFRDVVFSIIDNVEVVAQKGGRKAKPGKKKQAEPHEESRELPLSFFKWNDVIFQSFQSGYMRTFDLGFALALKGDIALSLYRYLGKKAYDGRPSFEIELETLYSRHLGLRRTPYASKMKERLKPAHDELVDRGFLKGVSYSPMKTRKGEKICYAFSNLLGLGESYQQLPAASAEESALMQRMLDINVSRETAENLIKTLPAEVLEQQLDCLSDRKPTDPAATFVAAVRGGWQPPSGFVARKEAEARALANELASRQRAVEHARQTEKTNTRKQRSDLRMSKLYAKVDSYYGGLDEDKQRLVNDQVRRRIGVLSWLDIHEEHPAWVAARRELLRDRPFRQQHLHAATSEPSTNSGQLERWISFLGDMLQRGDITADDLDTYRKGARLNDEEWQIVKQRVAQS